MLHLGIGANDAEEKIAFKTVKIAMKIVKIAMKVVKIAMKMVNIAKKVVKIAMKAKVAIKIIKMKTLAGNRILDCKNYS